MLQVNRDRCAYCGCCVAVCPENALTLAETRLLVDETRCTTCGTCLSACPTGALALDDAFPSLQSAGMPGAFDVVVVGAGPGGSTAARTAAQAGLRVLLLEKRQEIGSPVRCAEGIAHEALVTFIAPDPRWICTQIRAATIITVQDGQREATRYEGAAQGYVLERRIFDRMLAEESARAGATVWVKTPAIDLLKEDDRVCGVVARRGSQRVEIPCRVVIAADGVESQVGRWAGLDTTVPLRDQMSCAQYLLTGIDVDPTCTDYYLGSEVAPGGYAWVFPKGEGRANVGLGLQADLAREPAQVWLDRFVASVPGLAQGSPVTFVAGGVPVMAALPRLVANGLLLAGDAARQVDPLTGGGIGNAMQAGQLAAQVAAQALEAGDVSAARLATYQEQWQAGIGRKMARNYRIKERCTVQTRVTRGFLRAFALAVAG
jgi:digeranylgeranylglycerophospholipid reductase